jgi:hypothetical protein
MVASRALYLEESREPVKAPKASAEQLDYWPSILHPLDNTGHVTRQGGDFGVKTYLALARRNLHHRLPLEPGSSRKFSVFYCMKIPRLCRVLQGSEPAKAGRVPTRQVSLGRSLSHPCREIGSLLLGVGSERRCSIASKAGHMFYTIK